MNQYEQMLNDIQTLIKKVITDQKTWSEMLGDDKTNQKGIIKQYGMITELDYFAWPGGYPIFYVTKDGGCLCPKCANENITLLTDPDDPQWYVLGTEINYENDSLYCDNCNGKIDSAYGEDESEDKDDN
jgi:hypothetical protein